jgi:hypothetical protein
MQPLWKASEETPIMFSANSRGWIILSMRDDWRVVFPFEKK